MARNRWDETWHRLREWTSGQTPSERLAAQILIHEGYTSLDPSHPLGGPDTGKDAICQKEGSRCLMAVYFPRGQQSFVAIERKFLGDLHSASKHTPVIFAFVTNQELTLSERQNLINSALPIQAELYHLEKITTILDSPGMSTIRKQFLGIDYDEAPTLILGGQGGLAPGAGGGGGAALGSGAKGGDGGEGGRHIFVGKQGMAPGAGGGGIGVTGENSIGGQGGGGGDLVHAEIDSDELERLKQEGFDHFEVRVGQGGQSGTSGEDSIINFVAADGTVLKSIVAKGGKGGAAAYIPRGRALEQRDIDCGFHIVSAMLAECAQVKHGLLNLLGAGWTNFNFQHSPFEANWPLALCIDSGTPASESILALELIVKDPNGFQSACTPFFIHPTAESINRQNIVIPVQFTGSTPGKWTISIISKQFCLLSLPIDILIHNA